MTMQQIIQFTVVAVFLFIIYLRKIKPYLLKKKLAKAALQDSPAKLPGKSGTPTGIQPVIQSGIQSGIQPDITPASHTAAAFPCNPRHDIIFIDYAEQIDSTGFENRLTSRLTAAESELSAKGCTYRVDFYTLGAAIIAVITYTL